ncbi:hypothetical protein DL764_008530 [Monosporascus ibericus]|uniref:Uncharacterized protein n=1 Tax=Monosporascus ibericus TaxID=155417 RepID=A0A4Q4SZH1_9PEZI|nr:hypothetical protein DL764_008530 [Monosporascus ibericus]
MGAEAAIAVEGEERSLYDDGSNWTALYILVLLIPIFSMASMLYSNWSDRRRQSPKAKSGGGAAEDVENAAAVRTVYQRNHWFPWREASEDRRGRGRERAPPAPKPTPQAPQTQARTAVVPATFASSGGGGGSGGGGPVRDARRSIPVPMAMPSAHPSRPEEEMGSRPADPYDDNGAYGYGGRSGNGYGSEGAAAGQGRRDFQNVPF